MVDRKTASVLIRCVATFIAIGGVLLVAWILVMSKAVQSHTLITIDQQARRGELSGVYEMSSDGSAYFLSNQVKISSQIKIEQSEGIVIVYERKNDDWKLVTELVEEVDLFWTQQGAAFSLVPYSAGATIFPGFHNNKIEGWIEIMPNGDLTIEKVAWEKGLHLYLFPFYDEHRSSFSLRSINLDE